MPQSDDNQDHQLRHNSTRLLGSKPDVVKAAVSITSPQPSA
ncbi:hypothetical protein TNIN_308281, partial [Trichonephila inaurata madagascariensis]